MSLPKNFIDLVLAELAPQIAKDPTLKLLSESIDETELYSCLRDRIFRTDVKTKTFLDKIKEKLAPSPAANVPTKPLSEAEFTELLFESISETFNDKKSAFKILGHYFSPERDLFIKIQDVNKVESHFRVLTVKTN